MRPAKGAAAGTAFLGPQPAAAPLGMPAVGQGAFVFFLRPQGVFVSFVERLFKRSQADNQVIFLS